MIVAYNILNPQDKQCCCAHPAVAKNFCIEKENE